MRVKDEDAGSSVRCSYCGRSAEVPDNQSNDLDFLFEDVDGGKGEGVGAARGKPPKPSRRRPKRRRAPGDFNPFAVVVKLCYVALLLIVAIVGGRKFVLPLFSDSGYAQVASKPVGDEKKPKEKRRRPTHKPRVVQKHGLINKENFFGLYVASTPPGAMVYCLPQSKAPEKGRIHRLRGSRQFKANSSTPLRLGDGIYVVEVAFPWNDAKLTEYKDYMKFRRSIERASDERRRRLVDKYFLPDNATEVFVDEDERYYLVRQYRDVEIRDKQPTVVRALFLPYIEDQSGRTFSIEEIVRSYLPNTIAYSFDEKHVLNELEYHGVKKSDQPFVTDALQRIGVIPYETPDGQTRLFKIDLADGGFAAPIIRDAS